jgi:alanyl-tRNA synthetase
MTLDEITRVELLVNSKIRENIKLNEERSVPFDDAVKKGAMALFGEKYGNAVRVITFDPNYSVELCGGTHVSATGNIGLFKIVSEGSVAAGVRRIEAITAEHAEQHVKENEKLLNDVSDLLKHPKDLKKAISVLLDEKNQLQKALEAYADLQENQVKQILQKNIVENSGVNILIEKVELPNTDSIKNILFSFKQQYKSLFAVLAAEIDGKPIIGIMISEDLTKNEPFNAGKLVREWAKNIQGGGGGQAFFATAGGKDVSGLDKVIVAAKDLVAKEF